MARFIVLATKKIDPLLIAHARECGIEVVEKEFISTRPLVSKDKEKEVLDAVKNGSVRPLVFTSQHAVEIATGYIQNADVELVDDLKVFCLEGATKKKVDVNHWNIVATAPNAKELAHAIIKAGVTEIVFFCSNKRRDDLPGLLNAAGILVHEVIVYETVEMPSFNATVDGVLFFSPSAVHSYFSINQLSARTVCFAIGLTTASAIRDYTANKIITGTAPTQETLMAQVEFYFQNIKCHE